MNIKKFLFFIWKMLNFKKYKFIFYMLIIFKCEIGLVKVIFRNYI